MKHLFYRRIMVITCKKYATAHTYSALPVPSLDYSARGLCKQGLLHEAVHMLHDFHNNVHSSTYVYLLQCCIQKKALDQGKRIHAFILDRNDRRLWEDIFLQNTLLAMYLKCGSLVDARNFFDGMLQRNVFSWNVMIAAYTTQGFCEEALGIFYEMQRNGVQPNEFTFPSIVQASSSSASLAESVDIHRQIIRNGVYSDVVVINALIDMYAKFGNMHKARVLFDKMQHRDTISWNAMITGYAQNGLVKEAAKLFKEMPQKNTISWNAMITGYAQNGFLDEAVKLFNKMPQRNIISWNAMIAGYVQNGLLDEAEKLFTKMPQRNTISWNTMLAGYAQNGRLQEAEKLFKKMPERNTISWNAMVAGYIQNGLLDKAEKVFKEMHQKDTISWTAMIVGYTQNGLLEEALKLFKEMPQRNTISWNAMITGYTQNGFLGEALELFDAMPRRHLDSWNAVIAAYAQKGHGLEALKCFQNMQFTDLKPDSITFVTILPVCATFVALERGMEIHGKIIRSIFLSNVNVVNALIDMYAKCGSIQKACVLFDKMNVRDTASWNSMIAGYAMHGCGNEAIKFFEQMEHSGMCPDHITFISILSACNHAGLVDEGYRYFKSMIEYYDITPRMEHYVCLVDLLGRAGRLDEAKDFILHMPIKPDAIVWTSLLGACRMHNNLDLAEFVSKHLIELDPKSAIPYVLLSNIYAMSSRWNEIENVRKMMKDRNIQKLPGYSWIEVNKQIHTFVVGDGSHLKTQEIYERLSHDEISRVCS